MPRKSTQQIIEHEEPNLSGQLRPPEEFLLENHPANDDYMRGIEHTQRQIMHLSRTMRPKQVQIIKDVFAELNYTQAALKNNTTGATVSRLVNSPQGQRLLGMLQYHLTLIEGPNLAQRRNMLWRIAKDAETVDPKVSIKAIDSLNKMTYTEYEQENPKDGLAGAGTNIQIVINQELMPRGELDA